MQEEEMQSEQPQPTQTDERLEQALDRLGRLVVPDSASANDFVSRVMQRIEAAGVESRRPNVFGRWLLRSAIGTAACLAAALALWRTAVLWRTSVDLHSPRVVAGNDNQEAKARPVSPVAEVEPVLRTSTWSTVNESVVLEHDVPVRKLLYREFERVELLDSRGNSEGRLVVPTKAMLVVTKEQY
jgi:hypothetical protein